MGNQPTYQKKPFLSRSQRMSVILCSAFLVIIGIAWLTGGFDKKPIKCDGFYSDSYVTEGRGIIDALEQAHLGTSGNMIDARQQVQHQLEPIEPGMLVRACTNEDGRIATINGVQVYG